MEMKVYLVAAGVFLLLGTVSASKGKITADVPAKVVIGSEIKLTCSMADNSALPPGNVIWKKDVTIQVAPTATVKLEGSNQELLRIAKTAFGDAGSYTCQPAGKSASDAQEVVVKKPDKPNLTCTSTTIEIGATIKCTCTSANDKEIVPLSYEFKVAGTAKPAEGTNTPKNELTVTGTMALIGKEITCQAKFNAEPEGLSPPVAVGLNIPSPPKLECFPLIVPVGRVIKCKCENAADKTYTPETPQKYIFKVDGTIKTAEGANTPQNELSVTATMALDDKDISCAVEFKDFGDTSPAATVKLVVFCACTCKAAPTKVAGVSVMTIGCVLLLSTVFMKE